MLETSGRLLRLLSLLQTHRDWTGDELADRLGVTTRTIRRDIDKLRALDYPVFATSGATGGYRLGAGADLPPLLLGDDEAVAVAIGLRSAAVSAVSGVEEASLRALATVEQLLPDRLRRRVRALSDATVLLRHDDLGVSVETLVHIAGAIRDRYRLRLHYVAADGAETRRDVEPHRIVHTGRRWYLLAWDTDRADWRTLRVDRLTVRTPDGPRFAPRDLPDTDAAAYTSQAVSTRAYRFQAVLTVAAPASVVRGRIGPTVGVVTALDDQRCELRTGSHSLDELALYVGVLGHRFEVREPDELRAHLHVLAARFIEAAGPTSSG